MVNPTDEVSLRRIVNVPKRGVGDTSIARLEAWAAAQGRPLVDALAKAEEAGVGGRALSGVRDLVGLLDGLRADDRGPAATLEAVLRVTGYRAELESERSIEAEGRLENLAELVGFARAFEEEAAEEGRPAGISEFLEGVSLVADSDQLDPDESSVVLMTLHTAKGRVQRHEHHRRLVGIELGRVGYQAHAPPGTRRCPPAGPRSSASSSKSPGEARRLGQVLQPALGLDGALRLQLGPGSR